MKNIKQTDEQTDEEKARTQRLNELHIVSKEDMKYMTKLFKKNM